MTSCRDFFANFDSSSSTKCLCEQVDKVFPNGFCEHETVSIYSPGILKQEELIYRQIFSPIHIDEKGEVLPAAMEDASGRGMSVNRAAHVSLQAVCEMGHQKAFRDAVQRGRNDRQFVGIIDARVNAIRALRIAGEDAPGRFYIYDTATESNPSHADVCQSAGGSRRHRAQARYELWRAFSKQPRLA